MNYSTEVNLNGEVVRLLRTYKVNKVKIQLYDIEIEGIDEVLKAGKLLSVEAEKDCIEGMSLQAQKLNSIPSHHDNSFRSSTERAALDYIPEMYWLADRDRLIKRVSDIKSRMYQLKIEVRQVDAMLDVLNKEQRFIIEQYYIEGYRWPEVSEQYVLTFKLNYSINTLYAWREKAIALMESVYQKCG